MIVTDELSKEFPLVKFFKTPDREEYIVYDARANMLFSLTPQQIEEIINYRRTGESETGNRQLFEFIDSRRLMLPGGWDSVFDSSDENVNTLVRHNSENVLMRKYVLEVTQDCNFRCKYCSNTIEQVWRRHNHAHMEKETAKKAVDYYFKLYTRFFTKVPEKCRKVFLEHFSPSIGFYGGEPTMNWPVVEYATEYFKSLPWEDFGIDRNLVRLTSNTNLSVLTDRMLNFLLKHNFLLFASLDGPESEHDRNRLDHQGHPTFRRAYENLMKIKRADEKFFKENVTVMAVEAPDYDKKLTHEFLDSLGCHVSYLPMSSYGCFVKDAAEKNEKLKRNFQKIVEASVAAYDKSPEEEIVNYTRLGFMNTEEGEGRKIAGVLTTCPVGTDNIMVDVNGNLHICHKTDGSYPLGHIDSGLDDRLVADFYRDFARATDTPRCRECWALRNCGQCPAVRLSGKGFKNPDADECEYIRLSNELDFRAFVEIYAKDPEFLDKINAYVSNPANYQGVMDLSSIKWENYEE